MKYVVAFIVFVASWFGMIIGMIFHWNTVEIISWVLCGFSALVLIFGLTISSKSRVQKPSQVNEQEQSD